MKFAAKFFQTIVVIGFLLLGLAVWLGIFALGWCVGYNVTSGWKDLGICFLVLFLGSMLSSITMEGIQYDPEALDYIFALSFPIALVLFYIGFIFGNLGWFA